MGIGIWREAYLVSPSTHWEPTCFYFDTVTRQYAKTSPRPLRRTGAKLKYNYGIAASMHSNGSRRLSRLSRLEREAALTVARTSRRWSPHASSSRRSARRHG